MIYCFSLPVKEIAHNKLKQKYITKMLFLKFMNMTEIMFLKQRMSAGLVMRESRFSDA